MLLVDLAAAPQSVFFHLVQHSLEFDRTGAKAAMEAKRRHLFGARFPARSVSSDCLLLLKAMSLAGGEPSELAKYLKLSSVSDDNMYLWL